MEELIRIQQELKAPKNQRNSFGNYNYRSCEDILEAVKPILKKLDCFIKISDEMVNIGNKNYIKATVTLTNKEQKQESTTAYARESETRKGMDDAQITGATSSYARKYALNGLFLIDDNKDADVTNDASLTADELNSIEKAVTTEQLRTVWKSYKGKNKALFEKACMERKSEIENS